MSYDTDVLMVKGVKDWYDSVWKDYKKYHDWLDSFDKAEWRKYLPRNLQWLTILDIGSWDGRTYHFFAQTSFSRYIACDVSEKILDQHPNGKWVEKLLCNIEEWLPLADVSVDFASMFFTLEHIADLDAFFAEIYRVLKWWSRFVLTYFFQRRAFIHRLGKDKKWFKIEHYSHRYEDIVSAATDVWFSFHETDLENDGAVIGKAYCFMK